MMRMKTKNNGVPPINGSSGGGIGGRDGGRNNDAWELRPGGMLVQKRADADENQAPPPTIRVRVKYGSVYHQILINSQTTFGELKKMLTVPTGLHHQDQKLFYKDKERDSNAFLDTAGVKDKSKLVLTQDTISQEKRYLELRKNAKLEKAAKSVSEIRLEVDRFGGQVSAFESLISKGVKVAEKDLVNLIESLMNQLLKLDGISADGDAKLQKQMQVKRVQKYVEILDTLKIKNSMPNRNGTSTQQQQQQPQNPFGLESPPKQRQQHSTSGTFVITTQWETFDSAPGAPPSSTVASRTNKPAQPSFNWDLL